MKVYDVRLTDDGRQVMAKVHMVFGQVSQKGGGNSVPQVPVPLTRIFEPSNYVAMETTK